MTTRSFNPTHDVFPVREEMTISAVSDAHLGVKGRAKLAGGKKEAYGGKSVRKMMLQLAKSSDHLVLNGDMYEFIYPKADKSALREHAKEFLQELIDVCRENHCHLHYVVGNHDDNTEFVTMLEEMEMPDAFSVHPVGVRIGQLLFVHGDLPLDARPKNDIVAHERTLGAGKHYTKSNIIQENKINALGHRHIQKLVEQVDLRPKRLSRMFTSLLDSNAKEPALLNGYEMEDGTVIPPVKRICYGHSHDPFVGESANIHKKSDVAPSRAQQEIRFDNTGDMFEKSRTGILEYRVTEGRISKISQVDMEKSLKKGHVVTEKGKGIFLAS